MRPRVVVLLAALAIVLAGCGGSGGDSPPSGTPRAAGTADATRYAAAVNHAEAGLAARFAQLQRQVRATSTPEQDRRTLLAYERAVAATVGELRGAAPPAALGSLHHRLVAEVAGYGLAIRQVRQRLASGDPRAALAARGQLTAAVARFERRVGATVRAINRKLGG